MREAWNARTSRPLRIGVMMRGAGEIDGPGVYVRELIKALLSVDPRNEYVMFYRDSAHVGILGAFPNLEERVVPARSKLWWDQVSLPRAARRERLDVLFHHKFSVPFFAPCPTVVQQRGAEYWVRPEYYDWTNLIYNRIALPIYCRWATRIVTNSDNLTRELVHYGVLKSADVATVHAAADPRFHRVTAEEELARVRAAHGLPASEFLLMVAKGYAHIGRGKRVLYPSKNIEGTVAAYRRVRAEKNDLPPLVVLGAGIAERLATSSGITDADRSWIITPGMVPHEDMPAIYSMAGGLAFISYHESFGIPLVEAMQCGCPVITSTAGACPEVVGDAAIVVDPEDTPAIEDAIRRLLTDAPLAASLRAAGLERARFFSWTRSARVLLAELEAAAATRMPAAPSPVAAGSDALAVR